MAISRRHAAIAAASLCVGLLCVSVYVAFLPNHDTETTVCTEHRQNDEVLDS